MLLSLDGAAVIIVACVVTCQKALSLLRQMEAINEVTGALALLVIVFILNIALGGQNQDFLLHHHAMCRRMSNMSTDTIAQYPALAECPLMLDLSRGISHSTPPLILKFYHTIGLLSIRTREPCGCNVHRAAHIHIPTFSTSGTSCLGLRHLIIFFASFFQE